MRQQAAGRRQLAANGNGVTTSFGVCAHCGHAITVAVSILGEDGGRYHPGCWEAALVCQVRRELYRRAAEMGA